MKNYSEQLQQLSRAYRKSEVILSAFELGFFDLLRDKSLPLNDISHQLKISERGCFQLLIALLAMGILSRENNQYKLKNEYRHAFDPDSPDYIGGLLNHELKLKQRWQRLTLTVKSGQPAKKEPGRRNAEEARVFINAMSNIGEKSAKQFVELVRFNGNESVLDLGGGPGKYIIKLAETYQQMQLTLFEQPETIEAARQQLKNHPAYQRMRFISGDFLVDQFKTNHDVIILSNVAHIYDQKKLTELFKKCFHSLNSAGRLIIKDIFLTNSLDGPEFAALFSIHMLLSTENGRSYSKREIFDLLGGVGFKRGKTITMSEKSAILEGLKA